MKEITLEEKKSLMLSMLEEIDEFCRENNIAYFLTGGTLLGAIRHNGYIPWDDDVDIALPRKDYERLLNEFVSKTGNIEILNYKNKKDYIWSSAKIVHKKTLLIENNIENAAIGIFIDMFPLDYIDISYNKAKIYVKKVQKWKKILQLKHIDVHKKRSFIKKSIIFFGLKVLNIIPDKVLIRKIEKLSRKYENMSKSEFVCNFSGAWGVREIVKRKNFDASLEHVFEGKVFRIPIGYDDVLTTIYGDYMTPPPKEKRISTHNSREYWI